MDQYCMKDIWRTQNVNRREYSWRKKGNLTKASRIDFALVTAGLDQKVKNCMYLTGIQTDHRAFFMTVDLTRFDRGVGYWKFNNTLLQDIQYVQKMNLELDKLSTLQEEPEVVWEKTKKKIKEFTVEYSKAKVSERNLLISNLSEKVNEYEARLPLNKEEDELLDATKADLEDQLTERVKGLLFRSKVRWYEEGEKNTKYFYSLEKARYNAKTCYNILMNNKMKYLIQKKSLKFRENSM